MSSLTGLLYGGLVVYLGGWYFGKWTGNFSLLLLILTLVTLAYWLAERFMFAPKRVAAAQTLEQHDAMRRQELSRRGIAKVDGDVSQAKQALLAQPWWLDWTAGRVLSFGSCHSVSTKIRTEPPAVRTYSILPPASQL